MPMSPDAPTTTALFADMARFVWRGDEAAWRRVAALADSSAARTLAGLHIHASTTSHTLPRALAEAVPSVSAALSAEAFETLAQGFIAAHPPRRADLHSWGDELPGYLAQRDADPCVVAWARLDRAWLAALFAAEARPIEPMRLTSLPPADILNARLACHPSVQLVRLAEPWLTSWLDLGAVARVESERRVGADDRHVALVRPAALVHAVALAPAASVFLAALQRGASLVRAYEAAQAKDAGFDLQATLGGLFADGLFTDVLTGSPEP